MYNVETDWERDDNAAVLYDTETDKNRRLQPPYVIVTMKEMTTLPFSMMLKLTKTDIHSYERDGNAAVLCKTETDKDRPAQLRLVHNAETDYERDGNAAVVCKTETDKDRPTQL